MHKPIFLIFSRREMANIDGPVAIRLAFAPQSQVVAMAFGASGLVSYLAAVEQGIPMVKKVPWHSSKTNVGLLTYAQRSCHIRFSLCQEGVEIAWVLCL